jgi:hypothetical protein
MMQPENLKDVLTGIYSSKYIGYKIEKKLMEKPAKWRPKKRDRDPYREPRIFTLKELKIIYILEVFLTRELTPYQKIQILKQEMTSKNEVFDYFAAMLIEELENKHV